MIWQDEHGRELGARYQAGFDTRLTTEAWTSGTRLLPFVDPYGDTVFNQLQLAVLIEDLEHVVQKPSLPSDLKDHTRALVEYLRGCAGAVHTYVKIIGD